MDRTLYYVVKQPGGNAETAQFLREAASARSIKIVEIASDNTLVIDHPPFKTGDMLYKAGIDSKSSALFKFYATHFPVATLYTDALSVIASGDNVWRNTMLHSAKGLPIIKTVFELPHDKETLDVYAEYLGGYPIIIKALGGSHGAGVIRIDSPESLYSVAGPLGKYNEKFLMRSYVKHDVCARLIVLGDKVIASIAFEPVKKDFRTNAGDDLVYYQQTFSAEIQAAAVKAVQVLGAEFGGVDMLITPQGEFYLAEVNTPCNFPRCQETTGIDIAGMIIDHLIAKSNV